MEDLATLKQIDLLLFNRYTGLNSALYGCTGVGATLADKDEFWYKSCPMSRIDRLNYWSAVQCVTAVLRLPLRGAVKIIRTCKHHIVHGQPADAPSCGTFMDPNSCFVVITMLTSCVPFVGVSKSYGIKFDTYVQEALPVLPFGFVDNAEHPVCAPGVSLNCRYKQSLQLSNSSVQYPPLVHP